MKERLPEHKGDGSQLELTFAGGCTQIIFLLAISYLYDAHNGTVLLSNYCAVLMNTESSNYKIRDTPVVGLVGLLRAVLVCTYLNHAFHF